MFTVSRKLRIAISAYILWALAVVLTTGFTFENFLDWHWSYTERVQILLIFPPLFVLAAYILARWCMGADQIEKIPSKVVAILKAKHKPDPSNTSDIPIAIIKVLTRAQQEGKPLTADEMRDLILFNTLREDALNTPELGKPKVVALKRDGLRIEYEDGKVIYANSSEMGTIYPDQQVFKMPLPQRGEATTDVKAPEGKTFSNPMADLIEQFEKDMMAMGLTVSKAPKTNDDRLTATFVSRPQKTTPNS